MGCLYFFAPSANGYALLKETHTASLAKLIGILVSCQGFFKSFKLFINLRKFNRKHSKHFKQLNNNYLNGTYLTKSTLVTPIVPLVALLKAPFALSQA